MGGIFYDPEGHAVRDVPGRPEPGWVFLTHDRRISLNRCRRLLRELIPGEDISRVDLSSIGATAAI